MDYLQTYIRNNKFYLNELINDDFFKAIKLCFNNELYVSSTKLLLSFIDSISFIAYGRSDAQAFQNWLKEFCEMERVGVTPFELWEHRNAMLHMTSLSSRKVDKKECRMLIGFVGELPEIEKVNQQECGYYNIRTLIDVIAGGVTKYLSEKLTTSEMITFVERYDLIVSDVRTMRVQIQKE